MLSGEKQEQKEQTAEIKKIESPLAGTVIPLSEVHDEVFASEMMGKRMCGHSGRRKGLCAVRW